MGGMKDSIKELKKKTPAGFEHKLRAVNTPVFSMLSYCMDPSNNKPSREPQNSAEIISEPKF